MKSVCGTLVAFLLGFSTIVVGTIDEGYAFHLVSYNGKFTHWKEQNIDYIIDSRGSSDFSENDCDEYGPCVTLADAIEDSFRSWSDVPASDISFRKRKSELFKETSYDDKNSIVWIENNWGKQPFNPPSSAIAVTITTYKTSNMEIVDADIHFNGQDFTWAVIDTDDEKMMDVVDVQNIATHEIGHFIGLGHSSENFFEEISDLYLATMFFASGPGETMRKDLNIDDVRAVQNLYSENQVPTPEIFDVTPSAIDAAINLTPTLTIEGDDFKSFAAPTLVIGEGYEDLPGKVVSVTGSELTVVFDLYGVPSGEFDIVVANGPENIDRLSKAITVEGGVGTLDTLNRIDGASSGGGCGVSPQNNEGTIPFGALLMIFIALGFEGLRRRNKRPIPVRTKVPRNYRQS